MTPAWRFSAAPMMGITDIHWRILARLISTDVLLYTEMITAAAILHGDARTLGDNAPRGDDRVALQLGGSDPADLARAVAAAEPFGWAEYDLNCGCPSDRAQGGTFGACLMRDPALVARCVEAMRGETDRRVTVKHRIGVDDEATYDRMLGFVDAVTAAGAHRVTVHARAAWLEGLDPRANRRLPPLRHEEVRLLKRERPEVIVVANGGIATVDEVAEHLDHVDGVMLGRAVRDDPFLLADVEASLRGRTDGGVTLDERLDVVTAFADHLEAAADGGPWDVHAGRHLLPLFHSLRGARAWKRDIAQALARKQLDRSSLEDALAHVAGEREETAA